MTEAAMEKRREYYREYYRRNKARRKKQNIDYWERTAAREAMEDPAVSEDEAATDPGTKTDKTGGM